MNATPQSTSLKSLIVIVPDSSLVGDVLLQGHDESVAGELHEIEEIHARADTMTSILKGILDHDPAAHWGINE
jgi:hypothetical protein